MQNILKWCLVMSCGLGTLSQAQEYCENGSYSNFLMWVDAVESGEFLNQTGQFNNQYGDQDHLYVGYDDNSDQTIQWQAGLNELNLTPGRFNHPFMDDYPSHWQVWIDLNQDFNFTADERVLVASGFGKITEQVDLTALDINQDLVTRMRIAVSFNENTPPCGSIGDGEVEDYTVQLSPPAFHTWLVPEEFASIQSAVDAAAAGDRILVNDGIYHESILVDKELIIESVNGPQATTVSGNDHLYTFDVQSADVAIKGIAIENLAANSKADIYFAPGADNGLVYNNQCAELTADSVPDTAVFIDQANNVRVDGLVCETEGYVGIYSTRSSGGHFVNNSISYQTQGGIFVSRGESVLVENNTTNFNAGYGIYVFTVLNGLIEGNTSNLNVDSDNIYNGGNGIYVSRAENLVVNNNQTLDNESQGIWVALSEMVEVTQNMANGNVDGIHSGGNTSIKINNNTISENLGDGLGFYSTDAFEVNDNELYLNGGTGLAVSRSRNGQIDENQVIANHKTLSLRESNSIQFIANQFQAGEGVVDPCQVTLYQSSFNRFYLNSFLMLGSDLCSDQTSSNYWRSATPLSYHINGLPFQNYLGNYYLDGDHTDTNGDAIGDNSYFLPGSGQSDEFPLVVPASSLDIQF